MRESSAGSIDLESLTIGRLPKHYITAATTKCRARKDMILSGNPIDYSTGRRVRLHERLRNRPSIRLVSIQRRRTQEEKAQIAHVAGVNLQAFDEIILTVLGDKADMRGQRDVTEDIVVGGKGTGGGVDGREMLDVAVIQLRHGQIFERR